MNLKTYIITVLLAILADSVMGMIKKSPPYLFAPFVRLWKETVYLHSIIHDIRFGQWENKNQKYISLETIQAQGTKQKTPQTVLSLLLDNAKIGKPVVLLGEPGSGKSTSLQALTYHLARIAYRNNYFLWFGILIIAASLLLYSPILCLSWLASFVFWEFHGRRSIIPIFIESRSDYVGGTVAKWREEILINYFKGKPLFGSFNRIVWVIDGVNEMPADLYVTFIEGWRADLKKKKEIRVIFSSRQGENPAFRLELENTLTISSLDDKGVKEFIRVYSNTNALNEKNTIGVINRTFNKLQEEDLLDDNGIGRNPYWLKMIAESNFVTSNRGLLFLAFAKKLIQREIEEKPEERRRKPEWKIVPIDIEIDALADLAFVMQKEGRVGFIGEDAKKQAHLAISKIVEDTSFTIDDVLWEANAATLLYVRTRESIAFPHHLLQESFAAQALRNKKKWNVLNEIAGIMKWRGLLITAGELIESDNTFTFDDFVRTVLGEEPDISRLLIAISIVTRANNESVNIMPLVEEKFDEWLFQFIDDGRASDVIKCIQQEKFLGNILVSDFIVSRLIANLNTQKRNANLSNMLVSLGNVAVYSLVDALEQAFLLKKKVAELVTIARKIGEPVFEFLLMNFDSLSNDFIYRIVLSLTIHVESQLTLEFLLKVCELGEDECELLETAAVPILNIYSRQEYFYIFLSALNDYHPWVRWVSSYALGIIGNSEAIPYLKNLLENDKEFSILLNGRKRSDADIGHSIDNMDNEIPVIAEVALAASDAIDMITNKKTNDVSDKVSYSIGRLDYSYGGAIIKRIMKINFV